MSRRISEGKSVVVVTITSRNIEHVGGDKNCLPQTQIFIPNIFGCREVNGVGEEIGSYPILKVDSDLGCQLSDHLRLCPAITLASDVADSEKVSNAHGTGS